MFVMKLPREQKTILIESVQSYFAEERSETVGALAAEQLLDYMISRLGPVIYNHALADARKLLNERMTALEDELYSLEKPIGRTRL